ncbi:MAG: hypothetical protein Tsb0013_16820 [Phycisphaerales bacterium]
MSNVTDRRATLLSLGACALACVVMVGCSSDEPQRIPHGYYPDRDITPVADSSVGGSDAIERMAAFSRDTNLRRLQDDVHRMFLLDKPTSLSPKRGIWF